MPALQSSWSSSYCRLCSPEPILCNKTSHSPEKPAPQLESPLPTARESLHSTKDLAQPEIMKLLSKILGKKRESSTLCTSMGPRQKTGDEKDLEGSDFN